MVDNFELIEQYMEKQQLDWKEGDCYYVQLLRRQADDPMIGGVKDKKYHGNMHSRSIKDYLIKSVDHLEDVKEDIKNLCSMFNVRAYIRLNKRNYKNIALEMMKHIAEQCASGETYSSPFHLVSSACGQTCQAGKDKTWIVDCDDIHLNYIEDIIKIISNCQPNIELIKNYQLNGILEKEKAYELWVKENIFKIPTKSGIHLIIKPFNKQMFSVEWNKQFENIRIPDIHKDNPVILYVPDSVFH